MESFQRDDIKLHLNGECVRVSKLISDAMVIGNAWQSIQTVNGIFQPSWKECNWKMTHAAPKTQVSNKALRIAGGVSAGFFHFFSFQAPSSSFSSCSSEEIAERTPYPLDSSWSLAGGDFRQVIRGKEVWQSIYSLDSNFSGLQMVGSSLTELDFLAALSSVSGFQ